MITGIASWLATRPGQRKARIAFGAFALLLFTLTHWPALEIPSPVARTDIILHMCFFGPWAILCAASGWFGPAFSARNIAATCTVGVVYAGIDEGLQAIPFVRRQAGWDDFGADVLGVVAATLLLLILSRAIPKYLSGLRPAPAGR